MWGTFQFKLCDGSAAKAKTFGPLEQSTGSGGTSGAGRAGVQTLLLPANVASASSPPRTPTVAYLSGHYDPSSYFSSGASAGEHNVKYQPHYVESDVIAVKNAGLAAPHIDVLLRLCPRRLASFNLLPLKEVLTGRVCPR